MATQENALNTSPEDALSNTKKARSHYDSHLAPAETAARAAREGNHSGQVDHDDALGTEHIHTRNGYTSDQKGLFNSYAAEPAIYADQPGNLAEKETAEEETAEKESAKEKTVQSAANRKLAVPTILFSDWQKIRQEPIVWGTLLLFAASLIILLTLMTFMPYADSTIV